MKIAVIATVWFPLAHADVIVTRWVKPFLTDAKNGWTRPASRIASVYLDQTPPNDIGRKFCAVHGIPVFDSVRDALTLGADRLAVDAVLLIGEHGDYEINEFQQKLYPRKRLFDAVVAVFRESNRTVPVFNDKHLSWDFGHSCEMIATARELDFPLYAGSSLTHCPLDPGPPLTAGEGVAEALALFHGHPDHYGFHTMELVQSMVEQRSGGETGIRAVRAWEEQGVRDAVAAGEIPGDLLHSALVRHGYPGADDVVPFVIERTEGLLAYQLEYRDGLRATHLCLPKFVSKWVASVRTSAGTLRSCVVVTRGAEEFFDNFARLNRQVDAFFQTGRPPTPLLRTHLVCGALQVSLHALKQPGQWVQTPQLSVLY